MIKKLILLISLFLIPFFSHTQMLPLMPESDYQDEALLLQNALDVRPTILDGGYRQYDLVVAQMATWNDGAKDIIVRLILPPAEPETRFPLVAYVHGGGYIGGTPFLDVTRQNNGFSMAHRALLDEGFAVASVGYRLARQSGWPAQIADVLTGLRFLSMNGHHWGVEGSCIGITGHSAGARLAVLPGLLAKGTFEYDGFPWRDADYTICATWMWAGSAWDWPTIDQWVEFGKPTNYSVPRLLFGEHPATDIEARFRFRIRASIPHISMAMPPLYMIRGASDYGGDHSDAIKTLDVWQALGAEAHLTIVPGGHSATGPVEPFVDFFNYHLLSDYQQVNRNRNPAETAKRLNNIGEYKAAVEVLVQSHTSDHGNTMPAGEWIILHDGALLWNATGENWPENQLKELQRAKTELAKAESSFAQTQVGKTDWFRVGLAAKNAVVLGVSDLSVSQLIDQSTKELEKEKEVLQLLQQANDYWHKEKQKRALRLLKKHNDPRIIRTYDHLKNSNSTGKPHWASQGGRDVYGKWASIELPSGVTMRFRWVEPGQLSLPESLWYRNTTQDPFTEEIAVSKGFWMAETETTNEQWAAQLNSPDFQTNDTDKGYPVSMVNYLQILDWIEKLNKNYPDITLRLPTEMEWLLTTYTSEFSYPSPVNIAVHALSLNNEVPGPLPVNSTLPDLKGYFGLLGGVMEWTSSPGYRTARYRDEDGQEVTMPYPIARGGAWSNMPQTLDIGMRMEQRHGNRQYDLGFRIVIEER